MTAARLAKSSARHHAFRRGHQDVADRLLPDKFPGETNREWGRQIKMDQAVVDKVDAMWSDLGLPGSGKKIWR